MPDIEMLAITIKNTVLPYFKEVLDINKEYQLLNDIKQVLEEENREPDAETIGED